MKNVIKYWPILKYDLLTALKTTILVILGLGVIWGIAWLIAVLGLEIIMVTVGLAVFAFMVVSLIVLYFKDLPNRLEHKKFMEKFESDKRAYEERQRNAEH